jgi:hypothetical protein
MDEMMEKHNSLLIVSGHHLVHEWPAAGDEGLGEFQALELDAVGADLG